MKLTKQSLRQMIREAYKNGEPALNRKGKSKSKHADELRKSGVAVASGKEAGEFTPIERSLAQQIAKVVTDIASAKTKDGAEVDLGQYKAQLNTGLKKWVNQTGADLGNTASDEEKAAAIAAAIPKNR